MKEEIRSKILNLGADVCGFASVNLFEDAQTGFHPTDIWKDCKTVIVFGIALPKGLSMVDSRLIYGHFNENNCAYVDKIAYDTAKWMEQKYHSIVVPLPCDTPYEYWDSDKMEGKGILSMKHAAVNAGIGTLGKNTILLNKSFGNRLSVGAILCNLEIESDPMAESICIEKCELCIKNCPANALDGIQTVQKSCRQHAYGKTERGFDTVDCNKCRTICPQRFGIED